MEMTYVQKVKKKISLNIFQHYKAGMINNAFVILLSNAIIPLITYIFDFSYICKLIKRVMLIRMINNNYTQLEANRFIYLFKKVL